MTITDKARERARELAIELGYCDCDCCVDSLARMIAAERAPLEARIAELEKEIASYVREQAMRRESEAWKGEDD